MDYIKGYKSFKQGLITNGDIKFEVGVPMHSNGEIQAGPKGGNGFHMCLNFEDTFRFIENPILCEVTGYGTISKEYIDDYNGYYGIYACSDMIVNRIISREEIIEMAKSLYEERLIRFIMTYKMTDEEVKELLTIPMSDIIKSYIDYYHYGNKDVFEMKTKKYIYL